MRPINPLHLSFEPQMLIAGTFRVFILLGLSASLVQAQSPSTAATPRPTPPAQTAPGPSPADLPDDAPVITVQGLCPDSGGGAKAEGCSTTVTKAQFESMVNAMNVTGQGFTPNALRNFADTYARNLALADAALRAGLDKDPSFQELMRVVRTNSLAETYRRSLDSKYRNPSEQEVAAYYQKNISKYEQVKVARMFIPRTNTRSPNEGREEFERRAQKTANEIRDRAANGEDLDKLQKEAYKTLGLFSPTNSPELPPKRRGMLPQDIDRDVFALKSGGITRVEEEPAGFEIYKLLGRETLKLEEVKPEIVRNLYKEHLDSALQQVFGPIHTELSNQYFIQPGTPLVPGGHPGFPGPRPGAPSTNKGGPPTASPQRGQTTSPPK